MRSARFRTVTVMIAVAVVVSLLFSTSVLELGVKRSAEVGSARLGADMMILPSALERTVSYIRWRDAIFIAPARNPESNPPFNPQSTRYEDYNATFVNRLAAVPGVIGVSPQVFVSEVNLSATPRTVQLIGFDPETDFTVFPWLGPNRPSPFASDNAVAGASTGLREGQDLSWVLGPEDDLTLRVVGVLDPTNSMMDRSVFFPIQTAWRIANETYGSPFSPLKFRDGQISAMLIRLQADAQPQDIQAKVIQLMGDHTMLEASVVARRVALETGGIATYELLIAGLMGAAVLILIASLLSMTINERKRQLGLLRSIGATKRFISKIIVTEVAVVSIIGSIAGLGLGAAVLFLSESYLGAAYSVSFIQPDFIEFVQFAITSLVLGVVIGVGASTYPAYMASSMDPYDAVRRGE